MDPTIGEVKLFAGNFAPMEFMLCNGAVLPINQYTALYSLLGTTYGGDGMNTFALPNLQGRVPVGAGQGPGLANRVLGQTWGTENITLTTLTMPSHSHTSQAVNVVVNSSAGGSNSPAGAYWGNASSNAYNASTDGSSLAADAMNATVICNATGSGAAFSNLQPYLAMYYIIAVEGIYPSRN
ncbi:MAG: phage tail protein [Bacteroidia bacterium]